MPLILNLETATKTCSVALSEGNDILSFKEFTSEQFSHAEKLNLFIEEVLSSANKQLKDLDAIAVSAGPGSYTGLRIGTSTAKGLCYALDIPLIAVNSLKALANLVEGDYAAICPMFDARRMEVYTAVYSNDLTELKATNALVVEDESEFTDYFTKGKVLFIGPGAAKCQDILSHDNAIWDLDTEVSARGMASLANDKFVKGGFEDVAYFEPAYLKDFIAGTPKKLV